MFDHNPVNNSTDNSRNNMNEHESRHKSRVTESRHTSLPFTVLSLLLRVAQSRSARNVCNGTNMGTN
jgi:hypothetical protein